MFINILDSLCAGRNTTITAVLKALKLSPSKGTAWRNGSIPNGAVLAKLADYFGVTTDYLLGNEQKENPLSELDNELIMKCKAMSEEDKIKTLEYAELLIAARNQHK